MRTHHRSAYAGISVHNALLSLRPPPPDAKMGSEHLPWLRLTDWEMMNLRKRMKKNAKWRPSDEMIKKELAEIGRGPRNYAKAKDEATSRGADFVDEDSIVVQGSQRKRSLSDQPFLEPNRGMKLNEAKKRKREAHVPVSHEIPQNSFVVAHPAKKQGPPRGSDALLRERETRQGSEHDCAYKGHYLASAGISSEECVENDHEFRMVKPSMPTNEFIESILSHVQECEKTRAEPDTRTLVDNGVSSAPSLHSGSKSALKGEVSSIAPDEGHEPTNKFCESRNQLDEAAADTVRDITTFESTSRSTFASTAPAKNILPIDLTETASTDSDASSVANTEDRETSAQSMSLVESSSSRISESSAKSSPGDGSLSRLGINSSAKPSNLYGLCLKNSSKMVNGSNTGIKPGGDQPIVVTATDHVLSGKLDSGSVSSSRESQAPFGPFTATHSTKHMVPHGQLYSHSPCSHTLLDSQARETVKAAITRAIEARDPDVINAVERLDGKSSSNSTVAVMPPANQSGNARVSNAPGTEISSFQRQGEDQVWSTPARNTDIVSTQAVFHEAVPSCATRDRDRIKLKQAIESAIIKANELGDTVYGYALQKLYEQSLRNPTIAGLLVAVFIHNPSPAQSAEFASRVKAARNTHREHQDLQNPSLNADPRILPSPKLSKVSGDFGSANGNTPPMTSRNSSLSSTSTATPVAPSSATSASSNTQSPFADDLPTPPHPTKLRQPSQALTGIEEHASDVASDISPATDRGSSVPSILTVNSAASCSVTSHSSNTQSPLSSKSTNPPNPITYLPPSTPRIVPGGSGVMAFNRARRQARISAGPSGNAGIRPQGVPITDNKHQRLRDFVVNGKVT